jgi:hypothetical protein
VIERTPPLQTASIGSILNNCVREAKELRDILAKVTVGSDAGKAEKYWNAIIGVTKEKRIANICEKLEEEKSAFALCIASIDS